MAAKSASRLPRCTHTSPPQPRTVHRQPRHDPPIRDPHWKLRIPAAAGSLMRWLDLNA